MDSATLFGLAIDDWRGFALSIFAATAGYAALYVLGLDSKRLPFVPADHEYKVPHWFLAVSAGVLCFAWAFCATAFLTLQLYPHPPNEAAFLEEFFREPTGAEKQWIETLSKESVRSGKVSLQDYDGLSDVLVLVNNIRVFATHVDCVAKHQCRPANSSGSNGQASATPFLLDSRYPDPFKHANSLGEERTIRNLRVGENVIDIVVSNSGLGSCRAAIQLLFETTTGKKLAQTTVVIDDDASNIARFRTRAENGSYRLCERVRYRLDLHGNQLQG